MFFFASLIFDEILVLDIYPNAKTGTSTELHVAYVLLGTLLGVCFRERERVLAPSRHTYHGTRFEE